MCVITQCVLRRSGEPLPTQQAGETMNWCHRVKNSKGLQWTGSRTEQNQNAQNQKIKGKLCFFLRQSMQSQSERDICPVSALLWKELYVILGEPCPTPIRSILPLPLEMILSLLGDAASYLQRSSSLWWLFQLVGNGIFFSFCGLLCAIEDQTLNLIIICILLDIVASLVYLTMAPFPFLLLHSPSKRKGDSLACHGDWIVILWTPED